MLSERLVKSLFIRFIFFLIVIFSGMISLGLQVAYAQVPAKKKTREVNHYKILVSYRKGNSPDTVYYSKQSPLTWDDFKGAPRAESAYSAAAFTGFGYNGNIKYKGDTAIINMVIDVYFIQSYSWVHSSARTDYALAHEQLHFDITYLIVERLKKRLQEMELDSDYDSIIQYQYLQSYREMNRLQERYDNETRHGIVVSEQLRWQDLVKNWLDDLKE